MTGKHGNAYEIFILVLTLFSLLLMVLQLLPLDDDTRFLVRTYDNIACVIFLIDFAYNMAITRPRRVYFVAESGWLELIGSIPSLPWLPYTGLLRLARVARLRRIRRSLGGQAGAIYFATSSAIAAVRVVHHDPLGAHGAIPVEHCRASVRGQGPTPTSTPAVMRCGGRW